MLVPLTEIFFRLFLAPSSPLTPGFQCLIPTVLQFLAQILLSLGNFLVPKVRLCGSSICFYSTLYLILTFIKFNLLRLIEFIFFHLKDGISIRCEQM